MGSQSGQSSMVSSQDKKFAMEAAEGGMAEVKLAEVALKNASSDDVKKFAQMMIDDHTKANTQLMEIAGKKGITLPTDVNSKHKSKMDMMSKKTGAEFDKAYIADMLADHKKDVALFQREADRGADSDLKSFASTTLPTLQTHLQQVQQIHSGMGSGSMSKDKEKKNPTD